MDKKQLEEKLEVKTILLRIFIAIFIFESMVVTLGVSLINDKTNLIMQYKNEKEECLSDLEELLEKNADLNKQINEYKRVYGEIG